MIDRLRYYHEENIVNLIDQLDAEFSGKLNDICVSKAEVISVVTEYFESKDRDMTAGEWAQELRDRKLETYD